MASILGIDVGGTFTEFVYYEPGLETLKVWKTLSTPGDPSVGIIRGIEAGQLSAIDYLRLGTTIATNAILERKGATVAFSGTMLEVDCSTIIGDLAAGSASLKTYESGFISFKNSFSII